jgi:hypothetical protein
MQEQQTQPVSVLPERPADRKRCLVAPMVAQLQALSPQANGASADVRPQELPASPLGAAERPPGEERLAKRQPALLQEA